MTTHIPAHDVTPRHSPTECGEFRFDVETKQWWWSDETYRMHGFEPGEVTPTTALVLAHKHPDDRAHVAALLRRVAVEGLPVHSVHRIMDAKANTRDILLVAAGERGEDGNVRSVTGCFVDLTAATRQAADRRATEAIHAADAHRATIEQAKGVLSVVLGVSPDETVPLLRAASNRSNVPLRTLASWLLSCAQAGASRGMLKADVVIDFLRAPSPPRESGSRRAHPPS